MRNVQKSPVEQYFSLFLSSAAARGVKDKTLQTYKQHFHSISKRMDVTVPMNCLNAQDVDTMIQKIREEGLSDCSINRYNDDIIERHEQRSTLTHLTQSKRQTIKK